MSQELSPRVLDPRVPDPGILDAGILNAGFPGCSVLVHGSWILILDNIVSDNLSIKHTVDVAYFICFLSFLSFFVSCMPFALGFSKFSESLKEIFTARSLKWTELGHANHPNTHPKNFLILPEKTIFWVRLIELPTKFLIFYQKLIFRVLLKE